MSANPNPEAHRQSATERLALTWRADPSGVEVESLKTFAGAAWPALYGVTVLGLSIDAWAAAVGMSTDQARELLDAAVERLRLFYDGPPVMVQIGVSRPEAA